MAARSSKKTQSDLINIVRKEEESDITHRSKGES